MESGENSIGFSGVGVVGGCFGLGGRYTGTVQGPKALKEIGLFDRISQFRDDIVDYGDVHQPPPGPDKVNPKLRFLPEFLKYHSSFSSRIKEIYNANLMPLVLGGDHSISISSISSAAQELKKRCGDQAELGLLYVDAHPDVNTPETTPSGNIHGMSIAALLGEGPDELTKIGGFSPKLKDKNVIFIGLRDVDPPEREYFKNSNLKAFTIRDIDHFGIGTVCKEAFSYFEQNVDGFVISFDLDVCDLGIAPGVGCPVAGGISRREAQLLLDFASRARNLIMFEMMELNPSLDRSGRTTELALSFIETVLGRRIL